MKFIVNVDQQADGAWMARCQTLPDCSSTGATKEEALANLEEQLWDVVPKRMGGDMPLTIEVEEKETHD